MRILFAGTPEFALPALRALIKSKHELCAVYTQPDRPSGRGRKIVPTPVKALALSANIPVFQPLSLKTETDFKLLQTLDPELMVVVAYGMILPQAVLDLPKFGCINIHGSLLPRWRGAAPIQRALMAGDPKTGITIMQIIQKLDAGDMLHKEELPITTNDTAGDLFAKLAELGAIGLEKVLPQIEAGNLNPEKQDETQVTYADKLTKEEADIDWSLSAAQLARKVMGLNPWPVAQTHYKSEVLRIWRAEAIAAPVSAEPGIITCTHKNLEVTTGDGLLRLLEVQLPGGKRLPAHAFLNSHKLEGVKLG